MNKFYVVTPTMRHNKLPILAASIAAAKVPDGWAIEWRVRFMPRRLLSDDIFSPMRDDLLWSVKDGWWMYVSDDNLLNPGIVEKVASIVAAMPDANCIMFAQRLNATVTRAGTKEQLTEGDGECDGGAFVMNGAYFSSKAYKYHQFGLMERWLFKTIHDEAPDKFAFCNEALCYRDAQNFIFDPVPPAA